jgi:antitoxin component YwqK of YwqJK toxin-antitoxin module
MRFYLRSIQTACGVFTVLAVSAGLLAQGPQIYLEQPLPVEVLPAVEPQRAALPLINEPALATPPAATANADGEVVRERFPNGRLHVERQVVQDAEQNYINHGPWRMWDEQGRALAEGIYRYNEREGVWTRIYRARDVKMLTLPPFQQSQPPFISQATFHNGQLDGVWVIFDAGKHKLCEWEFRAGRRHGKSVWWYPDGRKMREINYADGTIDGQLLEWDATGKQVTSDYFKEGRRLAKKTEYYRNRQKRAEGSIIYPQLVLELADDWWSGTLATYRREGQAEKHGTWVTWHANGQKSLQGQFTNGLPDGDFVWWHENGQRSLQASYSQGKKDGVWTWWHPNGQKSIQGEYANSAPASSWTWWQEDGRVAKRSNFTGTEEGEMIAMPDVSEGELNAPSAFKPLDRNYQ